MRRTTLQSRFLAYFVLLFAAALGGGQLFLRGTVAGEARQTVREQLTSVQPALRDVLTQRGILLPGTAGLRSARIDSITPTVMKSLCACEVTLAIRALGAGGRVLATTLAPADAERLASILSEGWPAGRGGALAAPREDSVTVLWRPTGESPSELLVLLEKPLGPAMGSLRRVQNAFLLAALALALPLAVLGSLLFARSTARPIRQFAAMARRVAAGDYAVTAQPARRDEIGELSSALVRMAEEVSLREGRITELAYRDTLTGLPNRALFTERLQQAIHLSQRLGEPLSVLIMDLDQFKYVNDTLGHHTGDLLLREVAARLQRVLRRDSDTVARLGGDEFAILLPTEDARGAESVARSVLRALEDPMTLEGHIVDVRASIGIAVCPQNGDDLPALMRHADVAMYTAKRHCSGFALYDQRYDQHSAERLSLMGELRRAVEHNELVLVYQPKVTLEHTAERHVEALLRWHHPSRGTVMPADFIPFAEQTGYIKAISQWVLNEAVRQCAEWRREGLAVHVSINISARDLLSPELPQRFAEMLKRHGCDATRVWLEITESAIFDDPGHALGNLVRLRALGCRISIDDYGTGYSSLAYLKRLPVDELKIDRSFVAGMIDNHHDEVIVRSTIELAHNLGLKVVAEGVETPAMLRRLRDLHCDMAQGFLMSRPLSAADVGSWMRGAPLDEAARPATGAEASRLRTAADSAPRTPAEALDERALVLGGQG